VKLSYRSWGDMWLICGNPMRSHAECGNEKYI